MKIITQANIIPGTKILVRCDIDVIDNEKIISTFRPDHSLETLEYIISKGGLPIICGHVQQPKGQFVESLSTKPLKEYYDQKLGKNKYELLENLRFNPGEEANDPGFAKELANKAQIYVNEAFATCHRKHASIVGITRYLPSYAGLNLAKEVETLNTVTKTPNRPLVSIIGGAKLESKKPVISKFLEVSDFVLVGGKLGLQWDGTIPNNLKLPQDYAEYEKDIGPQTIKDYENILDKANTVIWAGPLGVYEESDYELGTKKIAEKISEITRNGSFSVIGGGNTIDAIENFGLLDNISFVSTGGGAMLKYIIEGNLPGIEALE